MRSGLERCPRVSSGACDGRVRRNGSGPDWHSEARRCETTSPSAISTSCGWRAVCYFTECRTLCTANWLTVRLVPEYTSVNVFGNVGSAGRGIDEGHGERVGFSLNR